MYKIGITGGIGSGKSVVCKIFESIGIPVYNADFRAKWIQNNDQIVVEKIIIEFGNDSYKDNIFNSEYIANIVFNNPLKLELLNNIIHPEVSKDYSNWLTNYVNEPYIIREAALMQEKSAQNLVDFLVLVTCPIEKRVERILKRDKWRQVSDIYKIIDNQLSDELRLPWVRFLIVNDGLESVLPKIESLHTLFLNKSL